MRLIKGWLWALVAVSIFSLQACTTTRKQITTGEGSKAMTELTTADDLFEAIRLAEGAFDAANANPDEYRLVQAQRMLAGAQHCSGLRCWRLTFKLTRLIPTQLPAGVGVGGELFFTVDLDEGRATFTGYGE